MNLTVAEMSWVIFAAFGVGFIVATCLCLSMIEKEINRGVMYYNKKFYKVTEVSL